MTWYKKQKENKLKKEAASYTATKMWLSPEGNQIVASDEVGAHEGVAEKIIRSMGWEPPEGVGEATKTLLLKGYARLSYDNPLMYVQFATSLSDDQITKLLSDFKKGGFAIAEIDTSEGRITATNLYELDRAFYEGIKASLISRGIIKTASGDLYGYWIDPNGNTIPVEDDQAHGKKASFILEGLGERPSGDRYDDRESLLEKGWITMGMNGSSGLAIFYGQQYPNDAQINTIQELSSPSSLPSWVFGVSVDFPDKRKIFMMNKVKNISVFLKSAANTAVKMFGYNTKMIKTADGGTKMVKVASKELEDFLKQPDSVEVNPTNQVGNRSNLYDVQRYVMDSYAVKTALSKTKNKITVSIFVNHGFLGSLAFNKYWTYDFSEWEEAIKLYKQINEVSQETVEKFVDEEITTTVFWPILKFELDKLQPERNAATNIPWVNYSRYYQEDDNPDWRQNIYGPRYPKYDEPSYNQEVRRKGVFTD